MINGFYVIYYTGHAGTGFAILVFNNGAIIGADVTGGLYDGHYALNSDRTAYEGSVTMSVPAGVALVTGQGPLEEQYHVDFPVSLPVDQINAGEPITLELPTGPVNVILKKIRDLS